MSTYVLAHHGIPGMKWGIRRYQRRDGTRTPAGRKRRYLLPTGAKRESAKETAKAAAAALQIKTGNALTAVKKASETAYHIKQTMVTGKESVDTILKRGTEFSRIQVEPSFIAGRAFYATHLQSDANMYAALYGRSLIRRSADEANRPTIHQVKLETTKDLRMPSEEKAANTVASLARNRQFRNDLAYSISDARRKMPRPGQKELLRDAQKIVQNKPKTWDYGDRKKVYEAFNLSLVYHEPGEVRAQNKFYDALKKKGYDAILDVNDKKYSSYHAKDPVIVFNTDSIRMKSATQLPEKTINQMYRHENPKRLARDSVAATNALIDRFATSSLNDVRKYAQDTVYEYLRRS